MKKPPKQINRLVGRAMHAYNMLADGDRVMLAVSGGIDSLVLCKLLDIWQHKAPIHYDLLAVHLDMGFGRDEHLLVEKQLERIAIPFHLEKTDFGRQTLEAGIGKNGCFHCAKQRRNRLFELAREKGCNKLALGHHRDDIIETFFLNLLFSGNLSTMVPKQPLFDGRLALIRPLAFLNKAQVRELGEIFGVSPVANPCPLAEDSKRESVRALLDTMYTDHPKARANIFAALANVKEEYLLTPPKKHEDH